MKNIVVIGSTGSIGSACLKIIERYPERYRLIGVACSSSSKLIQQQIDKFNVKYAYISCGDILKNTQQLSSLEQLVAFEDVDSILFASSGFAAAQALIAAIKAKKQILLANKESLVCTGSIVMPLSRRCGVDIIPVDSEHSAIWQCLSGRRQDVKKLIITASGGAFRDMTKEQLKCMKAADALKHPNWSMGKKITVDSSTLMNKGLEIIEAMWLFDMPLHSISAILHRESIIHSMVEYCDSSVIAQMSYPTMEVPISLALSYPERIETTVSSLDFTKLKSLTFEEIDYAKYPCFELSLIAAKAGGIMPTVLSAADEIAVAAFLNDKIKYTDIANIIECVMSKFSNISSPTLEQIFETDLEARNIAASIE